jgi:hypothetical protein
MGFENLKSTIANLQSKLSSPYSLLPTPYSLVSVIALGSLSIVLGVWWLERDASLRREGALMEIQRQTAAEVAALRARADSAVRDANQNNARAASQLEASRRLLARQSQDLREKLDALQASEQTRVAQVAVLPASEISARLREQLGEGSIEPSSDRAIERLKKEEPSITQSPNHSITQFPKGSMTQSPNHSIPPTTTIALTDEGGRKVETAFVELASCRERSGLQSQQLTTCEREGAAERVMVEQQKSSIAQLNQALGDKDQILAKREGEFKAELKVARGTWLGRARRTALHVAIGVALGMVVR